MSRLDEAEGRISNLEDKVEKNTQAEQQKEKRTLSSGQDGAVGRNTLLPLTTKRRITTNLKTINNQKCQKIKLHRTANQGVKETFTQTGSRGREGRQAAKQRGCKARQGWLNEN